MFKPYSLGSALSGRFPPVGSNLIEDEHFRTKNNRPFKFGIENVTKHFTI
jgi:hypothetical protein